MKQEAIGNFIQSPSSFLIFFCVDKKNNLIIACKNCLDLYFHALVINLGSESSKGNTLRLLLLCLWEES